MAATDGVMLDFSNFGSLKSTETFLHTAEAEDYGADFSNFGSLKSTETCGTNPQRAVRAYFSNFGSLKSTETRRGRPEYRAGRTISAISAR